MKLEELGKTAWTVVQVGMAATMMGGFFGGWLKLPSKVQELEEQVQDLNVIRAQLDWTTRILSDKFQVEPPDLRRFESNRRRRDGRGS